MHNQIRRDVQAQMLQRTHSAADVWMVIISFVTFFVHSASLHVPVAAGGPIIKGAAQPAFVTWLILIGLIVSHDILIRLAPVMIHRPFGQWVFILLKIGLTILAGYLIGFGQMVLYIGMLPLMMIESLNLFKKWWTGVLAFTLAYGTLVLYALSTSVLNAVVTAMAQLFTSLIVFYYWREYTQQVDARVEAENLLAELQLAYQQVEESSVQNERQRVARELHDTLTQGLAGVIMQLEAADNLLEQAKTERADEIIKSSIVVARKTLQDSRLTLTDLRSPNEADLSERLKLLKEAFHKNYQLAVNLKVTDVPELTPDIVTQLIRSVSECLMNVVKHAETKTVIVRGQIVASRFEIQVVDFGVGFKTVGMKKKSGHYGLTGIHERMAGIGGSIRIDSAIDEGTTVTLSLPMREESKNAN